MKCHDFFTIIVIIRLLVQSIFSAAAVSAQYSMEIGKPNNQVRVMGFLTADSGQVLPAKKTLSPYYGPAGQICFDKFGDKNVYYNNGTGWVKLLSTSTGGYVSNVSSGYGLLGGPITSTGTLSVDTATIYHGIYNYLSAGTDISMSSTGKITNTAPDQVVAMASGYGIFNTGTYPSFSTKVDTATIFSKLAATFGNGYGLLYSGRIYSLDSTTIFPKIISTIGSGTGINISGRTITNTAPDQTVAINSGYGIFATGTYPTFTIKTDTATIYAGALAKLSPGIGISIFGAVITNTNPVPVGSIELYPSNMPPSGWLICDGSSVLRATYPALFTVIGSLYGAVDSTHFSLPDFRQRFPLGKAASGTGNALAATGGSIDHTHTISHTHQIDPPITTTSSAGAHNHGGVTGGPSATQNNTALLNLTPVPSVTHTHTISTDGAHTHTLDITAFTSGTESTPNSGSNNPPFLVVNFIIKY